MKTITVKWKVNEEPDYPQEFIKGNVDAVRFVSDEGELFVEAESRTVERDVTLGVTYGPYPHHQTYPKVNVITCDAHFRSNNGPWRPHQPDVLYIVDGDVRRFYRL